MCDFDNIDVTSQSQQQIQNQQSKNSCQRFDKINSMTKFFYKNTEVNRSGYVKVLLRSSAILKYKNEVKNCFFWPLLANLHPCGNIHPKKVSIFKQ